MIIYVEEMEIFSQLIEWASINSHSYNSDGLEKMVELARAAFFALEPDEINVLPIGLSVKKRMNAPVRIFLGGHLDTVFHEDHPFQSVTKLDENTLQGPGVADMKGGILVMLHALLDFESSKEAHNIGWEVFLNLDEEVGSPNSTPFLKECCQRCTYALLFEPTFSDGFFVSERAGSSNYRAISTGKAAHAGRAPEDGKNAIYPLARFITSLEALNTEKTLVNVGVISGGGALNIIPEHAEAGINIRADTDLDSVLQKKAQEAGIKLERTSYRPPKPFNVETEQLFTLLKECGERLGIAVQWRKSGGVCDGNTFGAAGIPTLDTLGVHGGGLHTENEYVYLSSLNEKIKLTACFLKELARRTHT